MDVTIARIVGIVFLSLLFVVTVVLMPRIFGVNLPAPPTDEPVDTKASEPTAVTVRPPAMAPARERLLKS